MHDHGPTYELSGDITTLVVTHNVYVKLAMDEEWRAYYGAQAATYAEDAMETADDEMGVQFGINLVRYQTFNWDSYPDTGRDANSLWQEMRNEINPGQADVVLGYSKNQSSNYGGWAEIPGDEALVMWEATSFDRWTRTQHEVSHLFGALDRYNVASSHVDDVMEVPWSAPDFWCGNPWNDWDTVFDARARFD